MKWSSRLTSHRSIPVWLWGQNIGITFSVGEAGENCTSTHLQGCPQGDSWRLAHTNRWSSWAFWGQKRKFQSLSSFAYVSQTNLCTHVRFYVHPLTHVLTNSSTHCPFRSPLVPTLCDCSSALWRGGSSNRAGGNRYMTTIILCSIITQNLHCWVGRLHWFLQKYLLQREHRCEAKFWDSAFSVHWFQNNNKFRRVHCFNTFIQRHTSTDRHLCLQCSFPLSISLPLFKKPKDSQSNCSQILLSATCCRLPKQTAFRFSNSEVFITVSVRSESCYRRSWVQRERRSIPGINSTSSTPWHNRGAGKITGQVHCFNISVPSYYKARQCSGCPGKKKKKPQKLHPDTKNPPRVCSAKLGRELTREENPMISVSSSEANLYLLSNGNIWSSSLGNGENRRTRKERQGH